MNSAWSEWPAPAKLNLFLQIVGRRPDGYHRLQTVFQLLDWGDRIALRPRADGEIALTDASGIPAAQNLAFRAAEALKKHSNTMLGADIAVEKRIPMGGGLGGGSSDAATVLVALNEIWQLGLSIDALAEIGLKLGADVPVFARGHSAWAEGIGEQLTPIELPLRHFVIVDPKEHVSTAELFQAAELTRNSAPTTISAFLDGTCTANAFTPVVRARSTKIAAALDWLGRFGDARMSGSGGCVFAALDSVESAESAARKCPLEFAAYVAKGVNRSPLFEALDHFRD